MNEPWLDPDYNAKQSYDDMRLYLRSCWACYADRRPVNYFVPWTIERAHVVNKPRREDRRLVVMLCSICHKANHGERIARHERPRLTVAMMVGLKIKFDPQWVDLEFMQRHSVRRIPDPVELPDEYLMIREINNPTRRKR